MTKNKSDMLPKHAGKEGIPIDKEAEGRVFNFTVSGVITNPSDIDFFYPLAKEITKIAEKKKFQCELGIIVVFPIICDPLIYVRKDFISYKKSGGVFVGLNIEYSLWSRSRRPKKWELSVALLKLAIEAINPKKLSIENKAILISFVELAAKKIVNS